MLPRVANILLGLWLMVAPAVLGYTGIAEDNSRIIGPLTASFAVIAIWETTRPVRYVNVLLGFWMLLAPWVLRFEGLTITLNSLIVGVLIITFAFIRGPVQKRFGGGWATLWQRKNEQEK